jgi:hypothetical protein
MPFAVCLDDSCADSLALVCNTSCGCVAQRGRRTSGHVSVPGRPFQEDSGRGREGFILQVRFKLGANAGRGVLPDALWLL